MHTQELTQMIHYITQWAMVNRSDDYNYGTRSSYFQAALSEGLITQEEYEAARSHFGNLWDYRGD